MVWLSRKENGYILSVSKQALWDFWLGLGSSSHIDEALLFLKNNLNNIYYIISKENFLLFLREVEQRRNINNMTSQGKSRMN